MSFSLSFTAASLRPELLRAIVDIRAEEGSWEKTKARVLSENALQSRSPNSAIRMERELRQRLQTLTDSEISLFQRSTRDVQTKLAWLAAVKHSSFLFDFAADTLRAKLETHDSTLRVSDWERFLDSQERLHPEIASFSAMTIGKVKRVLLAMLRDVGILKKGNSLGFIECPILYPDLKKIICKGEPKWLAAFLVPEIEIGESRS